MKAVPSCRAVSRRFRSALALSALTVMGCFASHGAGSEPDDLSGPSAPTTDAGTDEDLFDPARAPECPLTEGSARDPTAPYPFCQHEGPDGYLAYCPMSLRSHGYLTWHATKGDSEYCSETVACNSCVCSATCASHGDCPRPGSGSASPECLVLPGGASQCWLLCDEGERCPDGMACVDNLEFGHFVCAWVSHGDRCE